MGRRSINTTKSGKYMNPTDQARKEARKRELKKNKKQRQMVRAAVLKGKDPSQIIMEMEKMDMMEYNVESQPTLSEKVLKDKRKKLKETLDRVLKLYEKENPEYWVEIRRMEGDYEKKRQARIEYYEAVRHAQAVTVDEIPLPNLDMPSLPEQNGTQPTSLSVEVGNSVSVPNQHLMPVHSILKKPMMLSTSSVELKSPPGCPPTVPPDLSDGEGDDQPIGTEGEFETGKSRTIRFAENNDSEDDVKKTKNLTTVQTKLLKISGQDIDDFMRETEVLFQEKVAERQADLRSRLEKLDDDPGTTPNLQQPPPGGVGGRGGMNSGAPTFPPFQSGAPNNVGNENAQQAQNGQVASTPTTGVPPPIMIRPPPRPGPPLIPGIRIPMVPPPSQGLPPRLPNMRLPPPIALRPLRPPGAPPGLPPPGIPLRAPPPVHNPNVLSAGPQLIARPKEEDKKNSATIEAKPQIRNLSADVTRFLPTALRVKREDKKKSSKLGTDSKEVPTLKSEEADRKPTKDDAYSQFMQEMEGLL